MTEEELEKKAKKYSFEKVCKECGYSFSCSDKNSLCSKLKNSLRIYQDGFNDGYSGGYEIGKKNERELQCGKKYIESLRQRIHSLETENASFREENKKLRQQFFELKSKIVDLIYNDENCLDKTIELLDDFECELEEDEG